MPKQQTIKQLLEEWMMLMGEGDRLFDKPRCVGRARVVWKSADIIARKVMQRLVDEYGVKLPARSKPIHPCDCTGYNGGQCYNCLNGAHSICSGRPSCKKKNDIFLGLPVKVKLGAR